MIKVLVIDDDVLMRNMYSKAFSYAGHEIQVVENGEDGLEKVATDCPDIVLLDIMMPKMGGMEVLQKLKSNPVTAKVPVIMLTNIASGTMENAKRAIDMGASMFIIKSDHDPANVVEMAEKIVLGSTEKLKSVERNWRD